ncbi:MAG TPA: hypothetical protein VGM98_13165 [Schlesneria sp.]|jgi:hypothetical protein
MLHSILVTLKLAADLNTTWWQFSPLATATLGSPVRMTDGYAAAAKILDQPTADHVVVALLIMSGPPCDDSASKLVILETAIRVQSVLGRDRLLSK